MLPEQMLPHYRVILMVHCNVGTGNTVTLLQLIQVLEELCGWEVEKHFDAPREGDIVHSSAVVERMNNDLGFSAQVNLHEGLQTLLDE